MFCQSFLNSIQKNVICNEFTYPVFLQAEAEKKTKRNSDLAQKKAKYAKQTKTMFLHAYNSYMVKLFV